MAIKADKKQYKGACTMGKTKLFDVSIVTDSKFTSMPAGAQALYFQLIADADEGGNIDYPVAIAENSQYTVSADLDTLATNGFIKMSADRENAMITHWEKPVKKKTPTYRTKDTAVRKLFDDDDEPKKKKRDAWTMGKNENVYLTTREYTEFMQKYPGNYLEIIDGYSEEKQLYEGRDNANDYDKLKKYANIIEVMG